MIESSHLAIGSKIRELKCDTTNVTKITGIKHSRKIEKDFFQIAIELAKLATKNHSFLSGIIFATQSPRLTVPCHAASIASHLDLKNFDFPMFDINQGCGGFLYAMSIANEMSRVDNPTLIICADTLEIENTNPQSIIFSDAISATLVTPSPWMPKFKNIPDDKALKQNITDKYLHMNGNEVFDIAVNHVPWEIKQYIQKMHHYDYIITHQPNLMMQKIIDKRAGIDPNISLKSVEEFGNLSMNSIPATIISHYPILKDKTTVMCGYGSGFSICTLADRISHNFQGSIQYT